MEHELKPISANCIPNALAKVGRYRYLNEPEEAESICNDILAVAPDNQQALRMLGLSITDQFKGGAGDRYAEAEKIFESLADAYERSYYTGILHERRAKAQLKAGYPPGMVVAMFEQAMQCFADAQKQKPAGNDDSILRWNRCVRILKGMPKAEEHEEEHGFDAGEVMPMSGKPKGPR